MCLTVYITYFFTLSFLCKILHKKDKALCENQVKLIYSRVYARLRNEVFFDLSSLRDAVDKKVREHNQTRMQQKPYCRQERFLSEERPALQSLPEKPFQIKTYRWYTVAKNGYICLSEDNHYYSVPHCRVGQKAQVIYTLTLVSIYVRNQCVATHERDFTSGGYTTIKEHLSANHRHWIERSPDYYLGKASEKSAKLVLFFERIFSDNHPLEHQFRSCDGMLSLERKTPADVFERALHIALENEIYSYRSMMNLIQNDAKNRQEQTTEQPLPKHGNIRGKAYYTLFDEQHFQDKPTNNKAVVNENEWGGMQPLIN